MTRAQQLTLGRTFLAQYDAIDRRGQPADPVGWLAFKFSMPRDWAERLLAAIQQSPDTSKP